MKSLAILFVLLVASLLFVFVSAYFVRDKTRFHNDFVRVFPPHAADIVSTLDMNMKHRSLAGATKYQIFIHDKKENDLLCLDRDLEDSARISIDSPPDSEISIDDRHYTIQNGYSSFLQTGRLLSDAPKYSFEDLPPFTTVQVVSESSSILRIIDPIKRKNVFIKSESPDVRFDVLETQVDGILCTDGYLNYSIEQQRLIYTYRYRNQFIVLDTNLQTIKKGNTIDTTSVAKISVKELNGRLSMSKPPLVVNKNAIASGRNLFIESNLIARNESIDNATDRSVIDVYNIQDASYRFSFYIPNLNNNPMQSFFITDTVLIASFSNGLTIHHVPSRYLSLP